MPVNEQEVNVQNMNVELVAQMFKNYQSNVLFHLEGVCFPSYVFAFEKISGLRLVGYFWVC